MRSSDRGIAIIIVALLAVVFVGLCALLFGAGYLAIKKNDIHRAANAAALAAVRALADSSSESRVTDAQSAALNFLHYNLTEHPESDPLTLTTDKFEVNSEFGKYYISLPDSGEVSGCSGKYPCFVANENPTTESELNAVRLKVFNKSGQEIKVPFGGLFGQSALSVSVTTLAASRPRCTSFIFDASGSSGFETHRPHLSRGRAEYRNEAEDPPVIIDPLVTLPKPPAHFAYSARAINGYKASTDGWDCANQEQGLTLPADRWVKVERQSWCGLRPDRLIPNGGVPWDGSDLVPAPPWGEGVLPDSIGQAAIKENPLYPRTHFQSDYTLRSTGWGFYYVDTYVDDPEKDDVVIHGAEPLYRILLGFNSALHTLKDQQTKQDYVQLKVFVSNVVDSYPREYTSAYFTNDLEYLLQVTNYNNIGLRTVEEGGAYIPVDSAVELPRNFLSHKMMPIAGRAEAQGGSNLVLALQAAINDLKENCPLNEAKRQILLATDGISTCKEGSNGGSVCGVDYNGVYLPAEAQLLGESLFKEIELADRGDSILSQLLAANIALNVMLVGSYVEPNFLNIKRKDNNPAYPSVYIDFLEAASLGYSECDKIAYSTFGCRFFDVRSDPGDLLDFVTAYENASVPYEDASTGLYTFRRPNGVLGKMVMLTGGLWCPDQPLDRSSCYEGGEGGKIDDACRTINEPQVKSILNFNSAQAFANCASQAIGWSPHFLVDVMDEEEGGAGY